MSRLKKLVYKYKARKYEWYIEAYEDHFGDLDPKTMLEIGIAYGGSAKAWQEFFPNVKYYAIDLKAPQKGEVPVEKLFLGNQSDRALLNTAGKEIGQIDIVIDDGSHKQRDQQISFETLWPYVSPGGWYVIEDLHTAYWPTYDGGFRLAHNTVEYLKGCVDYLNSKWFLDDKRAAQMKQGHKRSRTDKMLDGNIKAMYFYDSLCFIKKAGEEGVPLHL